MPPTPPSTVDPWKFIDAEHITGLRPAITSPEAQIDTKPGVARSAGPGRHAMFTSAPLWHPDNPVWWFGLIALLSMTGVFASSIAVKGRAGPYRGAASVSAGHGT